MTEGIVIDGRFLTQRTTGVQRYAREMVRALDAMDGSGVPIELICPPGAERMAQLRNIRQSWRGFGSGQGWQQLQLPWFAAGRSLLCLCNLAPVLCRSRTVVIHDAAVFDAPGGYSRAFAAWYRLAQRALAATGARIVTVSEFSRGRLASALKVPAEQIDVAGNAVDHVARIAPDASLLAQLGLAGKPYLLAIGSLHPNKNIATLEAAMRDPRLAALDLVVVGSRAPAVFRAGPQQSTAANVHYTGYATDEQLVALLQGATLFVFPSRYEGFGIPPLEAMRLGCPVLVSNAASIPEVCGPEAAAYFDPEDVGGLASAIASLVSDPRERARLAEAGRRRAEPVKWSVQAHTLFQLMRKSLPAGVSHRPEPT